jgi:hypothetical protein
MSTTIGIFPVPNVTQAKRDVIEGRYLGCLGADLS